MENDTGIVTIGLGGGFRSRLYFAWQLLRRGQITFAIDPENFIEEGERPSNTTCILRATPEELMAPQNVEEARRMIALADKGDDHVCIGEPPDLSRETFETS